MGFFNGGGATLTFGDTRDPSSFPQFGNRWRGGQIVEVGDVMPQTNMETREVIMRNGKPAEQLPVTLLCDGSGFAAQQGWRTDERNSNDHTDTGRRTFYVKGSSRFSIGDALRAVQADDLEVGGFLYMVWTGMGKTGNSSYIGRTWQFHYIKPTGVFLNSVSHGAPGFQNQAPPAAPQGAMPVQQNAQGQYAPQHTGFAPTARPVTAPPPQGWNAAAPSAAVNVAPPNPYGQHNPPGSPAANAAQQWSAQQAPPAAGPQQAWGAQGDPSGGAPMGAQPPAEASNPWGASPDPVQSPQAPYGPPAPAQQGTPAPPPAGNPWGQQ
jgi:hypothetical protein